MPETLFRKLKDISYAFTDNELHALRAILEKYLDEFALLLELNAENPHRVRAYRKARARLYRHEQELPQLIRSRTLRSIDGIGESISEQINDFCDHDGRSSHLEAMQLRLPPFLVQLLNEKELQSTLIKIYKAYPVQSPEELIILVHTRIVGSLLPITEQVLKQLMVQLEGLVGYESIPLANPSQLKGAATYVQNSSLLLQESEQDFINSLSLLLYGGGALPANSEQVRIRHQFHLNRPRLGVDFIEEVKESSNPLVDFLRYPGLFQGGLGLEESFLKLCEERQKIFLIPLHPLLRSAIIKILAQVNNFEIGILFGLAMPGLKAGLPQEIAHLQNYLKLDPRRIFNFQPAEVFLRSLLENSNKVGLT